MKFRTWPKIGRMTELLKICPQVQFFGLSLCILRLVCLWRGRGGGCGQERCTVGCSNVSVTNWKVSCSSPAKMKQF